MKTSHFFSLLTVVAAVLCWCGKISETPSVVDPPGTMIVKDLTFAGQDIQITADVATCAAGYGLPPQGVHSFSL